MKRVSIRKLLIIGLIAGYILSSTWYSWPFKGRVVDESGQPVAGAVVGMGWVVTFISDNPLVFKEVVTDKNGKFKIPGWVRMTPWPMSQLVFSPKMYVLKQGYRPLRLTSRWLSYNTDATPAFKQPVSIRKVNLQDFQNEHRQIYYFASSLCGEMRLTFRGNVMTDSHLLKDEILRLSLSLPKWQTNEYINEVPCL